MFHVGNANFVSIRKIRDSELLKFIVKLGKKNLFIYLFIILSTLFLTHLIINLINLLRCV